MKRMMMTFGICLAFLLAMFLVLLRLRIPAFEDSTPALREYPAASGIIGIGLLAIDALFPVPSSLVMIALGAIHGFAIGAALGFTGSMAGTILGIAIGRVGESAYYRGLNDAESASSRRFLESWGPLAITVTRPVPLLAETVSVVAGASGLSWREALPAAALGCIPPAILYAWAGAAGTGGFGIGVFALAMAVSGILLLIGRLLLRTPTP